MDPHLVRDNTDDVNPRKLSLSNVEFFFLKLAILGGSSEGVEGVYKIAREHALFIGNSN